MKYCVLCEKHLTVRYVRSVAIVSVLRAILLGQDVFVSRSNLSQNPRDLFTLLDASVQV